MQAKLRKAIYDYMQYRQSTFLKYLNINLIPTNLPTKFFTEDEILKIADSIGRVRTPYEYKACPYCVVYMDDNGCEGCPMNDADNNCSKISSSYNKITEERKKMKDGLEGEMILELEDGVTELKKRIYFLKRGE